MSAADTSPDRAPLEHFERLYGESADPWEYGTSTYEREKYAKTAAALPSRPGRALELGCSIGVFTELLAPRCDSLLALDFSPTAVVEARRRLAGKAGVEVRQATLPEQMPSGPFDAIVCSELLYYWSEPVVLDGLRRIEEALAEGGSLVAVHWLGADPRRQLDGEEVHRILRRHSGLERVRGEMTASYALDVWSRP